MVNIVKDYDDWNEHKKVISISTKTPLFKEGDIWWCSLGINIGTESFGKGLFFRRPVLVIKKLSAYSCIVLPISQLEKKGTWFHEISIQDGKRWVMLHQIRMIHTKRFQRHITIIDKQTFIEVKEKLEELLELSINHHPAEAGIVGNIPKTI